MDPTIALGGLLLGGALAALFIAARRATTVCSIDVRDGALSVTGGGIAPRILADLGDVTRRPAVPRGTIRIRRDAGRAAVQLTGDFSAAQAQQIRNVVGSVPLAKLANRGRRR